MTFRKKVLSLTALALVVAPACGSEPSQPAPGGSPAGRSASRAEPAQAFLQAMVPHHQSAIDMARVAEQEGESPYVKELAGDITTSQEAEIEQMRKLHQRLYRAPLRPDERAHEALGLTAQQAGMNHMGGGAMLKGKRPFDRAFVDAMVPHHEGAIAMARTVSRHTRDRELRELAQEIIRAQEREIAEMNEFREREYGGPVPETQAH